MCYLLYLFILNYYMYGSATIPIIKVILLIMLYIHLSQIIYMVSKSLSYEAMVLLDRLGHSGAPRRSDGKTSVISNTVTS